MTISGVGCWVVDYIYQDIDFLNPTVQKYLSKDGEKGMIINEASLIDELVKYFNKPIEQIVKEIVGDTKPIKNLGGVAIIAMITTSQLLYDFKDTMIKFYANVPNNELGNFVYEALKTTPLCLEHISRKEGESIITYVFCGKEINGESSRTFLGFPHLPKTLALSLNQLDDEFFNSDINFFGHIRWEPEINNNFTYVLKECKKHGSVTIVSTASDPLMKGEKRWLLGDSDDVYKYIDFLIMNKSEALHYSGENDLDKALEFFKTYPIEGILITDGINPTYALSRENLCLPFEGFIPVSEDIIADKKKGILPRGDTVGCGDNFVGGVIASIASQLRKENQRIDLEEACIFGNLNGGLASTIYGGLFKERFFGERKQLVKKYYYRYKAKNK